MKVIFSRSLQLYLTRVSKVLPLHNEFNVPGVHRPYLHFNREKVICQRAMGREPKSIGEAVNALNTIRMRSSSAGQEDRELRCFRTCT
ncbi:uncharacterized protein CLUP02_04344 [Colletotrichum lupini]|uniref:Uncharacterized protein n=1 Tax=Colletotrichum lupini TaxID=145971 RepID=A0A9Q8SL17_9PEZI|nr:uncharacterized protein CLUP02_04344 [Colletotrichum lupini]UQC78865.1 hypothetical protein CLUP02_04344 [Colletotrichum lupini]